MQFLKTLFWVVLAVVLVLFSTVNWTNVTLNLWGGLEADVKLPVLLLVAFLLGLLPTLIVQRARNWRLKRRIEMLERQAVVVQAPSPASPAATAPHSPEERIATDQKVWPAS
jgi:lipopolysaccharide assembly protein A